MVMMMASTPSLNASSRFFPICIVTYFLACRSS
jgi:hypothetical protein